MVRKSGDPRVAVAVLRRGEDPKDLKAAVAVVPKDGDQK